MRTYVFYDRRARLNYLHKLFAAAMMGMLAGWIGASIVLAASEEQRVAEKVRV